MFPKNTFKIVEFLLRAVQEYNINQIARELKISVGSGHKILKHLEKNKLIKSRKLGNAIYYKLNLDNEETQKIAALVLIESRNRTLQKNPRARVYASDLKEAGSFSKAALMFGSVLEKKEPADVDVIFIINKKAVKKVEDFCLRLSSLRPKKITPLIMTSRDLKNNIKKRDAVVLDILKKGIVLYGEDNLINILKGS